MNLTIFEESIPFTIHHDDRIGKYGEAKVEDILRHRTHVKERGFTEKALNSTGGKGGGIA